ncbi:hypothetical protein QCA50_002345 [Cerrena zonata]|uniref:Uncharacterized protein n=1 Tax=Cerrena zonata TaxID=2478898 RepID=A0AAW0GYT0_9APHY
MRRAQSLRSHTTRSAAAAAAIVTDDLGVLRETPEHFGETDWQALYLQEKEGKERAIAERDEFKAKYNTLMSEYQVLRKDNQSNELLLDASQKENIKCMSDISRINDQLQKYERQLEHLAGPNWRINLDLPAMTSVQNTIMSSPIQGNTVIARRPAGPVDGQLDPASPEAAMAQVEKVRLMILGMEERLQMREEKLIQNIKKAEAEGIKFEESKKQVMATIK